MRLTKDVEVLSTIPLFAKIHPANLKSLAFTSERLECLSGDELFHQDDYADAVFVILEGEADILVDTPNKAIKIATLGKNDIIGEIAISMRRAAHRHGGRARQPRYPASVEGGVLSPGHPVSAGRRGGDERTRLEAASRHPGVDCGVRQGR